MAGHFPLSKFDEPKIFELVEKIKNRVVALNDYRRDFTKFRIAIPKKYFECMKLPKDYVEKPECEVAYVIGKFSLVSITDEHPSITKNISLEVHFDISEKEVKIVNIFWVA